MQTRTEVEGREQRVSGSSKSSADDVMNQICLIIFLTFAQTLGNKNWGNCSVVSV